MRSVKEVENEGMKTVVEKEKECREDKFGGGKEEIVCDK